MDAFCLPKVVRNSRGATSIIQSQMAPKALAQGSITKVSARFGRSLMLVAYSRIAHSNVCMRRFPYLDFQTVRL